MFQQRRELAYGYSVRTKSLRERSSDDRLLWHFLALRNRCLRFERFFLVVPLKMGFVMGRGAHISDPRADNGDCLRRPVGVMGLGLRSSGLLKVKRRRAFVVAVV